MVTLDLKSARRGNRVLYLRDGTIVGDLDLGGHMHDDDEARHPRLRPYLLAMGW